MKLNIRKIIFGLILINICLILFTSISKADWAPDEIVFDPSKGEFSAPFTSAFTDGKITFCRAHGKSLSSDWGKITYKALYEKEDDEDDAGSRKIVIGSRLAYAFENASNDSERQNIIWHLNKANRNSIKAQYRINFRVLNTGPDSVGRPDALTEAIQHFVAPDNPHVSLDVSKVKVKVEKIGSNKYYKISKIDTDFGGLGNEGKVEIFAINSSNKEYDIYDDSRK